MGNQPPSASPRSSLSSSTSVDSLSHHNPRADHKRTHSNPITSTSSSTPHSRSQSLSERTADDAHVSAAIFDQQEWEAARIQRDEHFQLNAQPQDVSADERKQVKDDASEDAQNGLSDGDDDTTNDGDDDSLPKARSFVLSDEIVTLNTLSEEDAPDPVLHPDLEAVNSLPLTRPVSVYPPFDIHESKRVTMHRSTPKIPPLDPQLITSVLADVLGHFEQTSPRVLRAQIMIGRHIDRIETLSELIKPQLSKRSDDLRLLLNELSQLSEIHHGLQQCTTDINQLLIYLQEIQMKLPTKQRIDLNKLVEKHKPKDDR